MTELWKFLYFDVPTHGESERNCFMSTICSHVRFIPKFVSFVHILFNIVGMTCFYNCRGIDFALSTNDVPEIAHHLPSLVKQVFLSSKIKLS